MRRVHDGIQHVRCSHFRCEVCKETEYNNQADDAAGNLIVKLAKRKFHCG